MSSIVNQSTVADDSRHADARAIHHSADAVQRLGQRASDYVGRITVPAHQLAQMIVLESMHNKVFRANHWSLQAENARNHGYFLIVHKL